MLDMQGLPTYTPYIRDLGLSALPFLVRNAQRLEVLNYKQIANFVGKHHRVASHFLGYIRDVICIPNTLPLINAIVVQKDNGLPGGSFLVGGTSHLTKEEYRAQFEKLRDQVFFFENWDKVLSDLNISPIPLSDTDFEESARQYHKRMGGGVGEGERHLNLKHFVAKHPGIFDMKEVKQVVIEHLFPSGDKADVLFHLPKGTSAVVEIKKGPLTGELVAGIYQSIKYRALVAAEQGGGHNYSVHAYLCAYEIPQPIEDYAKKFDITCVRVSPEDVKLFVTGK